MSTDVANIPVMKDCRLLVSFDSEGKMHTVPVPPAERLMPAFEVDGRRVVMLTPQIAGVPKAALGTAVASLAHLRHEIVAALDVLVSGV